MEQQRMIPTRGPDLPPVLGEPPIEGTADVGAQRVARVYAEALYAAAAKDGQVDDILQEMHSLIFDVFRGHPQLETLIAGSAVGRHAKEAVIRKAFQGRASEPFLNFLLVVNRHDRLELLRPILSALHHIDDERKNRVAVQVWSAVQLPDEQRDNLLAQMRQSLQAELKVDFRVDPDLLGGLVVRAGDYVYDHSVRSQLLAIRKELIERSSHEIQSRRDSFSSAV
jgi:F-type H+-transporting ATPase subunit delta